MEEEAAHPKWAAIVKGEEAMAGDDESAFIASVSDAFGILQRTDAAVQKSQSGNIRHSL